MSRYFSNSRKARYSNGRTNLIAIIVLTAILSGILLYFTNERQNKQVLYSYCGDFGFYGKSLVLMKDSTFRFSYHGCSQANGFIAGNWNTNGRFLILLPKQTNELLDKKYQLKDNELIPINKPEEDKFTLCKYYKSKWERSTKIKIP
ncbi:hypothetical protein [Mangrovivirga cuniculi]|uniref:Uncharacterized protein n=1 Tax=Mangrovivirga cuniculi TaxID=2715131 RepID=A0A4D7JSC2_9BACT|nr:hypothetical protein [Mangrovivirga cuniculi]QCK15582.1 hypothetical protein DCC35_12905 [Mangrovivirga cuniculi]